MKKQLLLVFALLSCCNIALSQMQPVDVTDQTIKIGGAGGSKDLYFGFAEGDQIIFSFKEADGKKLKQIDISEYPSTPEFSDYKTAQIDKKVMHVNHKGIYQFHFENGALSGRICQITIQRIPASEATKNFNTDIVWKNVNDTTYDEGTERYLIKSDTAVVNLISQRSKIHSKTNLSGVNYMNLPFDLPINTIAWSYYIGVSQAGEQVLDNATTQLSKTAGPILSRIPGYGPMAALALGSVSYLTQLTSGDAVDYYITDGSNVNLFPANRFNYIKGSTGTINTFSRMTSPLSGTYYVCLYNENVVEPIQVIVKVTAVTVTQQWGTRPVKHMSVVTKNMPFNAN